jgi:hypothetical protein
MKKLLFLLAVSFATAVSVTAQEKERIVTGTVNLHAPHTVQIVNQYVSDQMYSGGKAFSGLNIKLGSTYRKHDNLSWDVYFTSLKRANFIEQYGSSLPKLQNPAKTQTLTYKGFNVGYGTYYHWNFFEKLNVKAGGMFDIYGASMTSAPDGINNSLSIDGQMLLKGHAAVKYGWDFKKWGLDLRGSVTFPLLGLMLADHPAEKGLAIVSNNTSVLTPEFRHLFLASYHNYMSFDYEMAVDFVLKPLTLSLGFTGMNKWWNVYNIQNIRKINCLTLGVSFDIVARNKFKSSNINF